MKSLINKLNFLEVKIPIKILRRYAKIKDTLQSIEKDLRTSAKLLSIRGVKYRYKGRVRYKTVMEMLEGDFLRLKTLIKSEEFQSKFSRGRSDLEDYFESKLANLWSGINFFSVQDLDILLSRLEDLQNRVRKGLSGIELKINLPKKELIIKKKTAKPARRAPVRRKKKSA